MEGSLGIGPRTLRPKGKALQIISQNRSAWRDESEGRKILLVGVFGVCHSVGILGSFQFFNQEKSGLGRFKLISIRCFIRIKS